MYKVNITSKTLEKIEKVDFKDIDCKERRDLQEWIAGQPDVLGEELLIIQKEFDGFTNTKERADLIALDKCGNIVIIENKLDDTGHDVVWQAVKYASYLSTARYEEICEIYQKYLDRWNIEGNAEENISEFYKGTELDKSKLNSERSQRIIFVAKEFRPEVVSAAMWLREYDLDMICIKMQPYKIGNDVILDVEQVIPQKESEEYLKRARLKSTEELQQKKKQNQSRVLRNRFWKQFLPKFQEKSDLYNGVTTDSCYENWLATGSGISNVIYQFRVTNDYVAVELLIVGEKEWNKKIFDALEKHRAEIESSFEPLKWEKMEDSKKSQIYLENDDLHPTDEEQWDEINEFLTEKMIKLHKAFDAHIKGLDRKMKN